MLKSSTPLIYPLLLILSIGKKSFTNLGSTINKYGDKVKQLLKPANESFDCMHKMAKKLFSKKKKLTLVIDDTLIRKIYSRLMIGAGFFYDTRIGKKIMAYRLMVAMITDGNLVMPIKCSFIFARELVSKTNKVKSKEDLIKEFIITAKKLFPGARITVVADGFYSTIEFLSWCIANKIDCDVRMHSNRKVLYRGKLAVIKDISDLIPKGRQRSRTIHVLWHNLSLYITAFKRVNKHNEESIIYLASTYHTRPDEHVANYKRRWCIEKAFRTTKQNLGLQDCYSRQMELQLSHVAAVFLAYGIAQLELKSKKLLNAELAIRGLKENNCLGSEQQLLALDRIFQPYYALA
jgi:Transposase DDE domain